MFRLIGSVFVILTGLSISAFAQTAQPHSEKSQPVKAESVTINMPEGMSKDQADEMLNELKAIHQLLERQQTGVQPQQAAASDKVKMSEAPGWYSLGRDDARVSVVEFAD